MEWMKCEDEMPPRDGKYYFVKDGDGDWEAKVRWEEKDCDLRILSKTPRNELKFYLGVWVMEGLTKSLEDHVIRACSWLKAGV